MDRKKTSASTKKKETPQPSAEASPSPPSILVPLCLLESTVKGSKNKMRATLSATIVATSGPGFPVASTSRATQQQLLTSTSPSHGKRSKGMRKGSARSQPSPQQPSHSRANIQLDDTTGEFNVLPRTCTVPDMYLFLITEVQKKKAMLDVAFAKNPDQLRDFSKQQELLNKYLRLFVKLQASQIRDTHANGHRNHNSRFCGLSKDNNV